MSSNTMDTAPGGETPQYESIQTVTKPTPKEVGQLGDEHTASAERRAEAADPENAEKTSENIRYGQNISESGMGGKTAGLEGRAQQGRSGDTDARDQEEKLKDARRLQGHGPMPNIGA